LVALERLKPALESGGLWAAGPLSVSRIGDGHSNPTFLISAGTREFVLRRPPLGQLAPGTHDVLREARLLRALSGQARVPRVVLVCDKESVLGAPFYVMEFVPGEILSDRLPQSFASPTAPRVIAAEMVRALVELHKVDWRAAGLADWSRAGSYAERQLRRFRALWEQNQTRPLPTVIHVAEWLDAHRPAVPRSTLVHGDFRLGNVIFAEADQPRLAAILDWEMAAVGDPLADVGYLKAMWGAPPTMFDLNPITRAPGFPAADDLVEYYEQLSGATVGDTRWYEVLALWKVAIIMEGNHRRAVAGLIDDPFAAGFADGVVELAERAAQIASRPHAARTVSRPLPSQPKHHTTGR
jgi:aminoglycoside phosphotransferase (APT) family kinase protein